MFPATTNCIERPGGVGIGYSRTDDARSGKPRMSSRKKRGFARDDIDNRKPP